MSPSETPKAETRQRSLFREETPVDGHGDDGDPGQQDEATREEKVLMAIGEFMGNRKRRRR